MSNNTRRRKRLSSPPSDESSSRPASPTQQQPSKRPRTGGKRVPTRPMTRSRSRPTLTTTATSYASRPNALAAQGSTLAVLVGVPAVPVSVPAAATLTQQGFYTAVSRNNCHGVYDEEREDETDEEDVDEDGGDDEDDDEDDEDEEDGTESEEQDDSQDEDYKDEDNNEDDYKRRKDFDKKRREYENDMLLRQREKEGESDVHADDEASSQEDSSQEDSSQGSSRQGGSTAAAATTTAPVIVIDEEEVEDGEEPELLETAEENYQRFYSRGDFDGDDSSSAIGGAGGTSRSSDSSSRNIRSDNNSRFGIGASTSSSLSSSASTPQDRSRYTSGLLGGGGQLRNQTFPEPLPGTLQAHLIEIDLPLLSENGEEETPKRERYHPEHFTVRERISDMYRLLAHNEKNSLDQIPPFSPTSPLSSSRILALSQAFSLAGRSLNTVSDLMDLLIRTYLPQFWLYRAKNKHLNRFARKQPKNPRPRESTLLATCVDCGFKFEKTPVFAPPATVRKADNEKRSVDNVKKQQGLDGKNTRAAAKERTLISATILHKYYQDQFPDAGIHYWSSLLTSQNVDDIFNNNRQEDDYDGNLDHFGLKEEGHHVDCPTNFYSTSEKATKLHFGWDLVVGHQHADVPRFSNPQRATSPPLPPPSDRPHQPHRHSLAPPGMPTPSPSPRSSPTRTLKPGSRAPPQHTYYPARSLMASFCHLLPRDLEFTTNELRKLFTYFVWHPWFDCDFQAITIRRGYDELWPLFLLRDEDEEVTEQEIQIESEKILEIKKKKRLEAGALRKLEAKKSGYRSATQRNQKPSKEAPKAPEPSLTPEYIEYKRQTQMENRFTTSFERGLSNHGVIRMIRNRSLEEYTRVTRQVRRGWVFGSRYLQYYQSQNQGQTQDQGLSLGHTTATTPAAPNITHFEKTPVYPGSIHIFTANDRTLVEKGGKLYIEPDEWYPIEEIPRFQNTAWTRPERADALDRLKKEVREWWDKDAEAQRKKSGFVLPEFARVRRWPAGRFEMVDGKLKFEVDRSVVEDDRDTETPVAKSRTVSGLRANMDSDYSPTTSTTDRHRLITGSLRTTRSTLSSATVMRASSQSQVQEMDVDVEMSSTSTSSARAAPSWGPNARSEQDQQHPSQPQHHRVRTPTATTLSTSSSRLQPPCAPTATGSRQSQLYQAQPILQPQHQQVQPPFMTVIPSTNTNTNVNAVARPMAVATGLPTTFSLSNLSTGPEPITPAARRQSRVNAAARPMKTAGPPLTAFPPTKVNTFPSSSTNDNTVARPMGAAGPLTSAYGVHATSVDNYISDLTNPAADFWVMYNQQWQSDGSNGLSPVDIKAAQQQALFSTTNTATTPAIAQSQPLNSLITPAALSAQYCSSHPAEPTMAFQGTFPRHAAVAPASYVSVSGLQNNVMNDMSQMLNIGAMRYAGVGTSSSRPNGNDLRGGFTRMNIGDRSMMMDTERDEDPEVAQQAAKSSGNQLWSEAQGGQGGRH
ncbi:hypothetical protein BGZ88_006292 [Linnemannia elongata]|nr:hypothetical protein BGZ88_006292 [Linnemannia elongata]